MLPSVVQWNQERILVTGGASFIGSHLVEGLLSRGAKKVVVVDDLSSGKIENIQRLILEGKVEFHQEDLRKTDVANKFIGNCDFCFHLAAQHGGRAYVDLHQADCANNFLLDAMVFDAALRHKIKKVVYASSGCIYPIHLQQNVEENLNLTEDMASTEGGYNSDGMYGLAKMMGELTLKSYYEDYGLNSVSLRFFTVYGPRGRENHAIMAMIARAVIKQDPYIVFGTGVARRNWTYVTDITEGMILAAEKVGDARAINLGTMESITVNEAADYIRGLTECNTKIEHQANMPVGPLNRICDFSLAQECLGWFPKVDFKTGVQQTLKWYKEYNKDKLDYVKEYFDKLLFDR